MKAVRRLCRAVRARLSGGEDGFTLAELLIVISIASTIVLVIGAAFTAAARTSVAANTRLRESKDAQILNAYFIADGSGISSFSQTAPTVAACAAGLPAGSTPVAQFAWIDIAGPTKVAYYYKVGSAPSVLKRRLCTGGTPGGSDATIGRNVAATSVACDPACSGIPTSVALTITETSGYSYTVELSPRSAVPTGTYDSAPSVRAIKATNTNPSNASQVQYSVTFTEAVTGVDTGDLLLTSTPAGATLGSLIGVGGGSTYTAVVNTGTLGTTADGTIRLDVVQTNTIKDRSAKALTGAATGETYTVDKLAPTVTLAQRSGQTDPTKDAPVFTATFSEAVNGFDAGDVTLTGVAGATASVVATDATKRNFEITIAGLGTGGTVTASIPAGKVTDKAGNVNTASTGSDTTITVDALAPKVVSINRSGSSPTSATSVSWTVTFSESVGGVDSSDFSLLPGTGFGGAPAVTAVSGSATTRTVTASTGTGGGTLGLNLVDNDSITDSAGNALAGSSGAVGDFIGQLFTVNTISPTDSIPPTITSVQLVNKTGGTAGTMEAGDQIVITYSERLKVSSICSTWSNDSVDQALSGDNDVTVSVTKGLSFLWWSVPDTITISAGSCNLNIGSIDLGITGYVNNSVSYGDSVTFGGSSTNKSTIQWDATNKKLTIKLGRPSDSSDLSNISSSTATYEADTGLTDPGGNAVSPREKATGSVRQF